LNFASGCLSAHHERHIIIRRQKLETIEKNKSEKQMAAADGAKKQNQKMVYKFINQC